MGKDTGFLENERVTHAYESVAKRKKNFKEFVIPLSESEIKKQGARCMDCGIPFCHQGCPLGNIIPDFNHYIYTGDLEAAFKTLISTNNFPDITGRICPAPCESACVLGINKPPVTIKSIEYAIAEHAAKKGWLYEQRKETHSSSQNQHHQHRGKVAVIGSGPAGLACADQLSKVGHHVTVFERANEIGGLLTYGIPNFKLDKKLVFKHAERMKKNGVLFKTNTEIGKKISFKELDEYFDAIVLAIGSTIPRDLSITNRDANGIYQAMDFLTAATGEILGHGKVSRELSAKGKQVLVVGGGDTGSDCIGTSIRQGAKSVTQIEILPQPPHTRDDSMPWPLYDRVFRVSTSQAEGCLRKFNILSKEFTKSITGQVTGLRYVEVKWNKNQKGFVEGKKVKTMAVDHVLLAMGFVGAEKLLPEQGGLEIDGRGRIKSYPVFREAPQSPANVVTDNPDSLKLSGYVTNKKNVFVAGDARRGQSLVVWAISEGRECAKEVDHFLRKMPSTLESKNTGAYQPGFLSA